MLNGCVLVRCVSPKTPQTELVLVTTEIRWLWLKYKLCRVKSFRVIVSMVKDRDQYIHIYVSPRGIFPGE